MLEKEVIAAGADTIPILSVNLDLHDFAILRRSINDASTEAFPDPLILENDPDKIVESRPVYVLGYPAKPESNQYEPDVLTAYFRNTFGTKRFAPGHIIRDVASSDGTTVFDHDASTLGGNSGSCVVDLANDGQLVAGLHFAGLKNKENHAHSIALLKDFMQQDGLTWRNWV